MPRLAITRRPGESFTLTDKEGKTVAVVSVQWSDYSRCSLVIEAPPEVRIRRDDAKCSNPH